MRNNTNAPLTRESILQDGVTNRNEMGQIMFSPTEKKRKKLLENIESCTPQQLDLLKREQAMYERDLCPDGLISTLQEGIVQHASMQPLVFTRKHSSRPLNPQKLLRQFEQFRPPIDSIPLPLAHNYSAKRQRPLFQWAPHETVTRVMEPVMFHIHVKHGGAHTKRVNPITLECVADLQDAMIHSHFSRASCSSQLLVGELERAIDATLTQIFMREQRVLFLFDWSEHRQFRLALCFDLVTARNRLPTRPEHVGGDDVEEEREPWEVKKRKKVEVLEPSIVEFARQDLFDTLMEVEGLADGPRSAGGSGSPRNGVGPREAGKRNEKPYCDVQSLRASLHDCSLSFLHYAFVRACPDDRVAVVVESQSDQTKVARSPAQRRLRGPAQRLAGEK
jgi:hypothetical protein